MRCCATNNADTNTVLVGFVGPQAIPVILFYFVLF